MDEPANHRFRPRSKVRWATEAITTRGVSAVDIIANRFVSETMFEDDKPEALARLLLSQLLLLCAPLIELSIENVHSTESFSLTASSSEIVCALGYEDQLVGTLPRMRLAVGCVTRRIQTELESGRGRGGVNLNNGRTGRVIRLNDPDFRLTTDESTGRLLVAKENRLLAYLLTGG